MIAIRVPKDIEDRLDRLAERTGRTKTWYVREAILEYLDDMEALYLAEGEFEDIKAGARSYTMNEAERELGLVD
jgi:RHH-type rel operon transcriptional repressor/antitoxin RelB